MRNAEIEVPVLPFPALQLTITMFWWFSKCNILLRFDRIVRDGLTFEKVKHFLTDFKENMESGGVMIFPLILQNHVLELLIVVLATAQVEDQVAVSVSLFQEGRDLRALSQAYIHR